ncbi:MAG: oligopeptide/dipeptide ABC transporter ATP-binding protein [Reyranellaceae bacterium]
MTARKPLLEVRDLAKVFLVGGGRKLLAVDGIDLEIAAGETLALVGESGSGKSTVARCILRLVEPTRGEVVIGGQSVLGLQPSRLTGVYRRIQMVFQDPSASLNPRMSIRQIIEEPLRLHLYLLRSERTRRVQELVEMVGLTTAHLDRYPHELSGGQRQRIGIARAIAVSPEIIILDEPTSSLDVSVRGQILDLLLELQHNLNLAYLFITHDLHVVQHVANRVAVMYLGGVVESGATEAIFAAPRHPYTKALLSAAPVARWGAKRLRTRLTGEISSPIDPPDACRLVGRCPLARPSCTRGRPPLVATGDGRAIACPVVVDTLPGSAKERISSC